MSFICEMLTLLYVIVSPLKRSNKTWMISIRMLVVSISLGWELPKILLGKVNFVLLYLPSVSNHLRNFLVTKYIPLRSEFYQFHFTPWLLSIPIPSWGLILLSVILHPMKKYKYIIIPIYYFTKWVEPVMTFNNMRTIIPYLFFNHVITHFGILK